MLSDEAVLSPLSQNDCTGLLMRTGAAISVVVHVAAVTVWLLLAGVRPFDPMTAEAITVDIVPASEAPPAAKIDEPPKLETPSPDFPTLSDKKQVEQPQQQSQPEPQKPQKAAPKVSTPAQAPAQKPPPPSQQAAAQPPAVEKAAPVEQPPPQAPPIPYSDITQKFSKLVTGHDPDFDAPAAASANISLDAAKSLREHLRTCSVLPKSISPQDAVKIVMRVALLRNGKLAKEPVLIEASASAKGPALMKSATDALLACQPYSSLPADKYDEWKVLDLSFTPKDFRS